MRFEWRELIERCPELAGLRDDAQSIAQCERWGWYEAWLPTSTILAKAVTLAAERLGVDRGEVRPVALRGLLDCYRAAKRRLQPAAPSNGRNRRHRRAVT